LLKDVLQLPADLHRIESDAVGAQTAASYRIAVALTL
jgi:hypothetical protein